MASYEIFEKPKIIYPDIVWKAQFALINHPMYLLNTSYLYAEADFYLIAVLNSPLLWSYMWRNCVHAKDEALRLFNPATEVLPIAPPTDAIRAEAEPIVSRLIEITKANQEAHRDVLDWLRIEHSIDKPGQKLEDFSSLNADEFVKEVKKRKPKSAGGFSPKAVKEAREVYHDYAPAIQSRKAEALTLEHRLSDLVNQAYGLTPEEIDLMWKTAPPRMPINRR